ncbi:NXPE family member 2-like [Ciona intestinalis]
MFRYSHKWLFAIVFFCAAFHVSFRLQKQSQKPAEKRQFYPKPRIDYLARYKTEFPVDSAWFGLAYQNLYGRPYSDFLDLKFEQNLENWTVYFPELMTSLNKLNQRKQNTDFTLNTFSNSRVVIVDKRTEYKTGDILNARIDAYNWKENKSSFGGDYFLARLIYGNDTLYPDGVSGVITDHRNGTYSIRVPLLIPGEARLEVRLMIPLEGIAELIRCTSMRNYIGTQYQSEYETKEKTECNIDFSYTNMTADEICDYSNPRNQEPWFCVKPPSGKCPKITNVVYSWERSSLDSTYEKCRNEFVHNLGCNQVIHGSGLPVTVSPGTEIPSLPSCKTSLNWKTLLRPNGYFLNGAWKSTFCDNKLNSIAQARPCFENKDVYFLGDSTTRQFHYLIAGTLGMQPAGPQNGHIWQQPQTAGSGNIRFYYRAHGPPLQNPGPPNTRPYVSDMLDEIAPGENEHEVVIVFNLGLHIIYFEPSLFIHRMRGIRDAMLRLNKRRTNVRYIYRSQRVLNTSYGRNNGWLAYRYNVLTREIFKNVENFFYFDGWDMSVVWPLNQFHPEPPYLEQEGIYLCNFMCNEVMG